MDAGVRLPSQKKKIDTIALKFGLLAFGMTLYGFPFRVYDYCFASTFYDDKGFTFEFIFKEYLQLNVQNIDHPDLI